MKLNVLVSIQTIKKYVALVNMKRPHNRNSLRSLKVPKFSYPIISPLIFSTIRHSGKGRTTETLKGSLVAWGGGAEKNEKWGQGGFLGQ